MFTTLCRTFLVLVILALTLAASAQHPLAGAWQETQIGFLVTFEQQPGGQLTGTLQGQAGPMPLNIVSDQQNAQGNFVLDGQTVGFAAQLQPDSNTLFVWLFEFDAAGQPLQDSYEQYLAYRAQAPAFGGGLPLPPAGSIPVMPGGGGSLPQPPGTGQPGGALTPPTTPVQPATSGSALGPQQGDITGTWRTDGQFDNGTPFTVELKFDASGIWRTDILAEGQPFAYFGGSYTFSHDGVLRYEETSRSPQVCFQGECQDNSLPDSSGDDQVYFQDADTIVTTHTQSGEQTVYHRSARATGGGVSLPQVPGSDVPGVGQPVVPPVSGGFPGAPVTSPPRWSDETALVLDSAFIGVWEAEQEVNENLTVKVVSTFGADHTWRQDFTHEGNPVAFYEGTFTVSPEGVLQLQVNNHSPELCLQGSCEPTSEADIIRTFQVKFLVSDTFDMIGKNSDGDEVQLRYWRTSRNGL